MGSYKAIDNYYVAHDRSDEQCGADYYHDCGVGNSRWYGDPIYLAVPVTMAASCAFMMPISTPPNAVVFSSGFIRMKDMIKAGVVLNIISILILVLVSVILLKWVF